MPDASEEASLVPPETGKVTDVVAITLDAQDSAASVHSHHPPGHRPSGMHDLLPKISDSLLPDLTHFFLLTFKLFHQLTHSKIK